MYNKKYRANSIIILINVFFIISISKSVCGNTFPTPPPIPIKFGK